MKRRDVAEIEVPRFQELSVQKMWPLVKEDDELNQYFPNHTNKELRNRDYMFSVLGSLRQETLQRMVANARKNRAKDIQDEEKRWCI